MSGVPSAAAGDVPGASGYVSRGQWLWVGIAGVLVVAVGLALGMPVLAGLVLVGAVALVALRSLPAAMAIVLYVCTGLSYSLVLEYRLQSRGLLFDLSLPFSIIDACAVLMALSLLVAWGTVKRRASLPRYLILPLWLYLGAVLIGVLYGISQGNPRYALLKDLRVQVYFLLALFATAVFGGRREFMRLLVGVFVVSALSVSVLQFARMLGVENATTFEAVRDVSIPIYIAPIASAFLTLLWFSGKSRLSTTIFVPLQAIYLLAVLLSFTRSVWVQLVITYVLVFLFLGLKERRRALGMALVILPLVLFGAPILGGSIASHRPISALVAERAISLAQGEEDRSQASRLYESGAALSRWLASPIFGAGMGMEIDAFDAVSGHVIRTEFLHNSPLYYALKMGIIGFLAVGWLYVAAIKGAMRARAAGGEVGLYASGLVCSVTPMLLITMWSGGLNSVGTAPVLGVIVGLNWPALTAEEAQAKRAEDAA